jgi:AraC family transcriptional regulator
MENAATARTRRYRFDVSRARGARGVTQRLLSARTSIQTGYLRALHCAELARDASMSRFHFIRSYTQAFGVSPYRELINVRIDRASEVLEHTRMRVAQIAAATGFTSPAAFAEAFRRERGCSAREWRRRASAGRSDRAVVAAALRD